MEKFREATSQLINFPEGETEKFPLRNFQSDSVEEFREATSELINFPEGETEKFPLKNFQSDSVEEFREATSELINFPEGETEKFPLKNFQSDSINFLSKSELVSVIILCYNHAQYLAEAVESIVKQTYQNWECLIINDGSLDQTSQIATNLIKKYPEKNLRLIEKENSGVPNSRNVGIDNTSGKFILFVDADDKIHPNFITETLAVLQTNPQVGFVYTDIQKFGFEEKLESHGDFNVKRFLSENQAPVTSLFRREIYQQVGGFKKIMNQGWEDWEFWISAYQKGWLGYRLEKPYLYYRQHPAGSRQQKLHQNSVNLAVHKAIIIYLHSQLYSQQEVTWSEQVLSKYKSSIITQLNRLKSKSSTMINLPIQYPQISSLSEVKNRPFWSVMIPTYNPTSTLEQTLKSVLQQAENINEMQIEVVDDCSTQVDVEAVVKKIGHGRISYYRQPKNLGLVANWNDCIKRASGKFVHILHQDDLVLVDFYSSLKNLLEKQPEVGAAFCRHYYIDENNNQKMVSPLEKETPGIIPNWLEKIAVMQRIQCASIVVKRSVYEQLGGFCLEANSAADWEMWKRIAAYYPVSYDPQTLACYRLHSTSETSRLIEFGGNISDTRKSIEISESYLPKEISKKLSDLAREHYAISATKTAQQMLSVGKTEVAIAQIQEALKCSHSSEVKEGIISLFITSDATLQIDVNQVLSEIYKYVQEYQKDSSKKSALNNLRQLRQQIANYWLNLPTEKLEGAYLGELGRANQKLIGSNIKYEQISETEKAFVNQIATHISQGLNRENSIQYLLAATLYYYPHQLSPKWFVEAPIPKWFVNDYIKFMIDAPNYFQEIGEADKYYRYTLNWINYLHQRIFSNSDSKIWQDMAWFVAHKYNFIPLYFNNENLKDIYIKRAEIMELGLQSRGFNLDYVFPERAANRNKIRLGILSSHFIPQTETFSTLPFFEHLDKTKFEIILYAKSTSEYPLEKYCQSRAERFIKLPDNLISQVETIRNDDLDILLIGTNVTAITNPITLLALHRLARIQVTSTSSCVTTGMRHIDYYISGKLTEPPEEAKQQYQEKLITLKGAAHCFNYYATEPEKPVVKPSRESWGVNDKNIVFVSGANFYKIIPELRETWAKIIAAVPNSILVLYPFNPNWTNSYQASTIFVNDMRSIFKKYGIDKKRLIVIKTLPSRSDIKECLKLCDIYLDSYPFAGVNSLIEPLEIGIPIVTKNGNSFRSLMGSALLRALSIPDLIADSEAEYINLAIKVANNSEFRKQKQQEIQEKMQQNPSFLDSHSYSKQIGTLFQGLFQQWENIHLPKTIESQDKNSLTSEFINRLVGCVNLYKIDPNDQSLIEELRQVRKQIADFWLDVPPKNLETIYQGKVRKAYLGLLASGIQNEPQTEEEEKFIKELADTSIGLTNPKGINALLGGMLYFPPGKMLVRDAKNRLPHWLINDYKQVFESREVAQKLEKAFQTKSPHLSEDSIDRGLETKGLATKGLETKPLQVNVVLTENKADNLDSADQKFLNQLLGTVNLYYIDPSDESVVKELRQLRKQTADFWINLEPQKLETFYLCEMGKGYQALLNSRIQNQSLIESEQEFLQHLATQLAQGIEAPKALNYLLAAMLYCRSEQLRIEDIDKLPNWLLQDYQKFAGN
ncbi:MAG: glycosyltransferase [Cyanobacteria bacterium P01_H01_bin.35]